MSSIVASQSEVLPSAWRAFWLVAAVCFVAYVLNLLFIPVPLIPILGHDDGHYMSQARSIIDGEWLGAYDQMTLIKGPGFPLFLVLNRITHLPYPVPLAAFECGSFILFSYAVGRGCNSPRLAAALLVALSAFPWMWS